MARRYWRWGIGLIGGLALLLCVYLSPFRQFLFSFTGEEALGGQMLGLWQLAGDAIRPRPVLAPDLPIAHAGVNPFGINTFLQQEVEPAKRERQVQMIADAGFHWIRQEFPWYDIEIHGKGDFEDRRFEPRRSAWEKYDDIVALAEGHNLEIIARLSAPPAWSRADGTAHGAFAPPDNFDDFVDFAAAVAGRYAGRVRYFQVWNEPNIYPEWGEAAVDPEAYTDLLCRTYRRLKGLDPNIVVLSGALAPTSELTGRDLNDFVFLQRMYDAGAGRCFDILSMQGYGLFSGPTDRRRRPIHVNYNRNPYVRDIMVKNGDAGKAIWISEMNWNALPPGSEVEPIFGRVSDEQQARYAPLAYQRAQEEWPWIGVINFWYFKRADDSEKGQASYYFRMVAPNFTPLPVYRAMKEYMAQTPVMYPGHHQEDHWATRYFGDWRAVDDPRAELGHYVETSSDAGLTLRFSGSAISLVCGPGAPDATALVQIDNGQIEQVSLGPSTQQSSGNIVPLAAHLPDGEHTLGLRYANSASGSGPLAIDGFIVRAGNGPLGATLLVTLAVLGAAWAATRYASPPSRLLPDDDTFAATIEGRRG